jgi:hypothetical protein
MLPADDVVSSIELLIITAVAVAEPNEVVGAAAAATTVAVEMDDGEGKATPPPLDTFVETVTTTAGTIGAVDVVVVVVVVTVAAELTPSIDAAF